MHEDAENVKVGCILYQPFGLLDFKGIVWLLTGQKKRMHQH